MKKTIITAAIGDEPWLATGVSMLQSYAAKVGAELLVLNNTNRVNPQLSLFDAMTLVAKSDSDPDDRFMWMDADIVITKNAIDLFEYCDPRFVWGTQTWGKVFHRVYIPWVKANYPELSDFVPYASTGIVSFTKDQAIRLMEHDKDWPHVGDQEPFNVMWRLAGLPVRVIPIHIHGSWVKVRRDSKSRNFRSFYHCAGKGKAKKMRIVAFRAPVIDH